MAAAELQLLGSVGLVVDGTAVPLGGARQRAIVAYLALHGARPVPIPRLVDDVWGTAAPRTVVKSLSTLASRLRHSLGPHGFDLRFDDTGYALHVPTGGLDIERFRAEVGLARLGELEGDPASSIGHLRAALACWRGEPFDGLGAPFVDDAAAELVAERADIEDELARLLVRTGAAAAAVDLFESLVARDPFREDRWAALVRAYSAGGRRSDALDAFQRARRVLVDEIGIEPGEQLRAAARAAVAATPAPPAMARPAAPAPPLGQAVPVVASGRSAELAALEEEARAAVLGEMRGVVITGEQGAGKSHLVKAFTQGLANRDVLVVVTRCDPFGSVPLGPLLALVEQSHAFGTIDAAMLADAPMLFTLLSGEIVDHPIGDAGDLRRNSLLLELRRVVRRFSVPRPYVVIVEDFHWVDPLTLAAFEFMAEERTSVPVLFILTAREPELRARPVGKVIDELHHSHPVRRLHLGPLDRESLRPVIAEALAATDDPEGLLDVVVQGSGGNPLYARHLARQLAAGADPAALPDDLRHLMDARIRGIHEEARELLVLASVLGTSFSLDELAVVFPDTLEALTRRAETAREAGLLEVGDGPGTFHFVHGLIRQAAYEMADTHQQALLHLAAATIRGYGGRRANPEIVHHLLRARSVVDDDEVARAVVEAAGPALVMGAHETALELCRAAEPLEVGPELRAELHLMHGAALVSAGDHQGITHLDAGYLQARELGRWGVVADCLLARSRIARLFSVTEARTRSAEIVEVLEIDQIGRRRRLMLLAVLSDALLLVDPAAALRAVDEMTELAPAFDRREEIDRHIQHLRLRHRFALGAAPDRVAVEAAELVDRSAEADDPIGAAHSAVVLQAARVQAGLLRDCVDDCDRLIDLANTSGRVDLAYQIRSASVSATMAMEPLGVADQVSELLSNEAVGAGTALSGATRLLHLWLLRREQLRLAEITWFFETVVEALDRPEAAAWVAACRAEAGQLDEARALLTPLPAGLLASPGDWSRPAMLAVVTDLAFDLGVSIDARRFSAALRPLAGQMVVAAGWVQVLGRADRYLGRLAQMRGDLPGAIELFATARHLDQASGAHLWASWAAHDEARARLARNGPGDRPVAEALLDGGLRTAKRLGARRLAGSIRDMVATTDR